MMNSGSSSSGPPIEKNNELNFDFDFDFDLDSWINELHVDNSGDLVVNSGVDTTTITPNYQPTISTMNVDTSLGGSSANQNSTQSQGGIFTANKMPSYNRTATVHRSDVRKFASNSVAQISQPRRTTDFPQNQPLLKQVFKNKAVQQPLTHSLSNQSSITFGDQKNQLHYQMPSNQLLPCTRPLVNIQTVNQQNSQSSRQQIQQNSKQKELQLQQGTGTSSNSISGGRKRRNKTQVNLSAPVGFATPAEYPSSLVWREYVLSQIQIMKEGYLKELQTMHHNAEQLHNQAKNVDAAIEHGSVKTYLSKMIAFLNITTIDAIPQNDERVYNYMNVVVNLMNYHKNKTGGSSQYNPPLNPSQGIPNLEANMVNFNQNFPSRKPQRGRMPGSLKNTSFQMDQKPMNPLRSGSFKAPQATVLSTSQQINPGTNTSSVRSGSPISLFSNTTGTDFPSRPLNDQPRPVENQSNLEKTKQPMQKPNDVFLSPAAKSTSQQTNSPQLSLLSVSSSSFDVNTVLSPQAIARSPFLLSSTSPQSGGSSLSSLGSEKLKTPVAPPCTEKNQEPQNSKDPLSHLIQVVNSISPKTLGSSLTDISSIVRQMDYVPPNIAGSYMLDDGDFISVYDHEVQSKMKRKLNISSVYQDQYEFDFDDWDIFSAETSVNKSPKIENEGTILEEIKEINSKLLETSMHMVLNSTEDSISMLGGEEGTIIKCLFKNVCFPDLRGSASSEEMPEFVIQLLVPLNYPVSSPTILNSGRIILSEPWEMLYGETMTRFDLSLREVPGQISIGDMARNWDASARSVMTEFVLKRGGKSFSSRYGSWENCINSSSGSN